MLTLCVLDIECLVRICEREFYCRSQPNLRAAMKEQAEQQKLQDAMLSALAEESVGVSRTSLASSAFADPLQRQRCVPLMHALCPICQTHEYERVGVVHGWRRATTLYALLTIAWRRFHDEFRHCAAV